MPALPALPFPPFRRPPALLRTVRLRRSLRRLVCGTRAAATLEMALGAVCLLAVSAVCFDLYSLLRVDTASARSAVAVAEYVSFETDPDGDGMEALGKFLHRHDFAAPAAAVIAVSAVHQPQGGNPTAPLWTDDTIRIGAKEATDELAAKCTAGAADGWKTRLLGPQASDSLGEGETAVIVEVCSRPLREGMLSNRLIAGDLYRVHILPVRDFRRQPAAPVRQPTP